MKLFEVLQPLLESKVEYVARKYMKGLLLNILMEQYTTNLRIYVRYEIAEFEKHSHDMGGPFLLNTPHTVEGKSTIVEAYIEHMPDDAFKTAQYIVQYFADNFDPTPNNKYLDWVVRMYATQERPGNQFYIEDYEMVADVLSAFHTHKRRMDKKDINQYKSFTELKNTVEPFMQAAGEEKQIELIGAGEAEVIYESGSERIIIPHTVEAAKAFSKGTKWCTQYPNMFKEYTSQGPIYIIDTPDPDDRVQIHFESDQIMNVRDDPVEVSEWNYPPLKWLLNEVEEQVKNGQGSPRRALFFLRREIFTLGEFAHILLRMEIPKTESTSMAGIMLSALRDSVPEDEETLELVIEVFKSEPDVIYGFKGIADAVKLFGILTIDEYAELTNEFLSSVSTKTEYKWIANHYGGTIHDMLKGNQLSPNDAMDAIKNVEIPDRDKVRIMTLILQFLLRTTTPVDPDDDSPIAPDWYVDLVKKEGALSISNKRILGILNKDQFLNALKDLPNDGNKWDAMNMFLNHDAYSFSSDEKEEILKMVGLN